MATESGTPGESEHLGWEVEYLDRNGHLRTQHPSARHFTVEPTPGSHEAAPVLVLMDEDEETIAVYSSLSWVAARRISQPGEK